MQLGYSEVHLLKSGMEQQLVGVNKEKIKPLIKSIYMKNLRPLAYVAYFVTNSEAFIYELRLKM